MREKERKLMKNQMVINCLYILIISECLKLNSATHLVALLVLLFPFFFVFFVLGFWFFFFFFFWSSSLFNF